MFHGCPRFRDAWDLNEPGPPFTIIRGTATTRAQAGHWVITASRRLPEVNVKKAVKPLKERFFLLTMSIFSSMVVVFPNSNRNITIPLIFVVAIAAWFCVKFVCRDWNIVAIWYLSCVVTVFYILVGVEDGYPEAISEVVFVYMISPALWLLII